MTKRVFVIFTYVNSLSADFTQETTYLTLKRKNVNFLPFSLRCIWHAKSVKMVRGYCPLFSMIKRSYMRRHVSKNGKNLVCVFHQRWIYSFLGTQYVGYMFGSPRTPFARPVACRSALFGFLGPIWFSSLVSLTRAKEPGCPKLDPVCASLACTGGATYRPKWVTLLLTIDFFYLNNWFF